MATLFHNLAVSTRRSRRSKYTEGVVRRIAMRNAEIESRVRGGPGLFITKLMITYAAFTRYFTRPFLLWVWQQSRTCHMIGVRGVISLCTERFTPINLYADAPGVSTPFHSWMLLIANRLVSRSPTLWLRETTNKLGISLMPRTPFESLAVHAIICCCRYVAN